MTGIDGVTILVAILTSTTISGIVRWLLDRRRMRAQIDGDEASTYQTWLDSNARLAKELEEERTKRRQDRLEWQSEMAAFRAKYDLDISELRSESSKEIERLKKRMRALEAENTRLIVENHNLRQMATKDG